MNKFNFSYAFALAFILLSWSFIISSVSAFQFEGIETQLTTDQEDQFDPSISGGITVYTDRRNADADIYYYDIENNQEVQITEGGGDQFFNDISGNLVAYTDFGAGHADIYIYNIENGTTQQITNLPSNQRNPSISGNLVVYEDDRNGNYDIYLYNLDSGIETPLTVDANNQINPDISGTIVVWEDYRKEYADIFMVDVSAENPAEVNVTEDFEAHDREPSIDGNIIAYSSNSASLGDIYLYRITDDTTEQITFGSDYERNPEVSGDFVAYESYAGGDADIWIYSISLGVSEQATINSEEQYLHAISSNRLVYTDNRNGNLDIYLLEFQFVSDMDEIIAFFDASVEAGTLWGKGDLPWIANKRLKAFRCMLVTAGTLIDEGYFGLGCFTLERIYRRSDGYLRPPDFIVGDAREELVTMILQLKTDLGCE
jgi:beta propeller repeat protein